MPGTPSDFEPAKIGYGTLNDVSKPIGGTRERQSSGQTFLDAVQSAAQNQFSTSALANTGPYKAIVLRVEKESGEPGAGSWMSAALSFFGGTPPIVKIKARIPEVHAALPVPKQLGSAPGEYQKIIDLYPTYIAQTTAVPEPAPGDIVYVDYGNKNKWTDPIYLKPLIEAVPGAGGAGGPGAGGAFGNCGTGPGVFAASAPTGDALPAKNKPLTLAGLPLLPRTPAIVMSGESILLKGDEGAYINTVAAWEKAMTANGIPGKTWIGNLDGNGAGGTFSTGDSEHNSEDKVRDTIIFVPNIADVSFTGTAKTEMIVYFHDFGGFESKSFEGIANTLKKMALDGRNFVFIIPELPWSANTSTPSGRTDLGFEGDNDSGSYETWWEEVLDKLEEVAGSDFDQPEKTFISAVSSGAGRFAIFNAIDDNEFHGFTGDVPPPQRIIASIADPSSSSFVEFVLKEYLDYGADDNPEIFPEISFLCPMYVVPSVQGKIDEVGPLVFEGGIFGEDASVGPHQVVIKDYGNDKKITIHDLLTWINTAKEEAKLQEDAAKAEAAKNEPMTDESENAADNEGAATDLDPPDPTGDPPSQPDPQGPPAKDPDVSPSETPKASSTSSPPAQVSAAVPYTENRVKTKDYGSLVGAAADNLLRLIPEAMQSKNPPNQRLHTLALTRFEALRAAASQQAGLDLKVQSAWRKHSWKSFAQYESAMIAKYGSVKKGRKYKAFDSPHETGLALDFGSEGLEPKSATISKQKKTAAFAWLKANAHFFGLTPYKTEPWHWEIRIPYDAWAGGEEFVNVGEIPASYAVSVGGLGGKNAQLPTGPGGGGGAPCVSPLGGGGSGGGTFTPVQAFNPGAGPANLNFVAGPKQRGGGPNKPLKKIQMFVIHETGGSPKPNGVKQAKSLASYTAKKPDAGVHFWGASNGDIVQCAPLTEKVWHANWSNYLSVGIEICAYSSAVGSYDITKNNKYGAIIMRPDDKGHIKALSVTKQGKMHHAGRGYQLPSELQCRKTWELILWISNGAGGTAPGVEINLPIQFPCVPDANKFYWRRWAGGPIKSENEARSWWPNSAPEEAKFGIVAHHRWNHGDGIFPEFYCFGRAKGLSSEEAYYAAIGALATLEKGGVSPHPNPELTNIGKDLMGSLPLNPMGPTEPATA